MLLWLLGALSCLPGCLSFRSVIATASVGQMIGPRASALGLLPVFCQAENILSRSASSPKPSCPLAEIERTSQELSRYSQNVSAYAAMLRDIAEFDDNRVSDPLDRVVVNDVRKRHLNLEPLGANLDTDRGLGELVALLRGGDGES